MAKITQSSSEAFEAIKGLIEEYRAALKECTSEWDVEQLQAGKSAIGAIIRSKMMAALDGGINRFVFVDSILFATTVPQLAIAPLLKMPVSEMTAFIVKRLKAGTVSEDEISILADAIFDEWKTLAGKQAADTVSNGIEQVMVIEKTIEVVRSTPPQPPREMEFKATAEQLASASEGIRKICKTGEQVQQDQTDRIRDRR